MDQSVFDGYLGQQRGRMFVGGLVLRGDDRPIVEKHQTVVFHTQRALQLERAVLDLEEHVRHFGKHQIRVVFIIIHLNLKQFHQRIQSISHQLRRTGREIETHETLLEICEPKIHRK